MRILKFFLKLFLVLFILFFIVASIYVKIYGKSLVERALNTALERNVTLGAASYHFPLGVSARNVHIAKSREGGEFLTVKKILAQLSAKAIIQGKFAFDTVVLFEPSLVIEGKKIIDENLKEQAPRQGIIVPPVQADLVKEEAVDQLEEKVPVEVSIKRLVVKKGKLRYVEGLTEKGFSFNLEDILMRVNNLVFPLKEGRSDFQLSAHLIKEGNPLSGSDVLASGWVDAVRKDMEAKVEVIETSGIVGLTAKAVSKNNDMTVTGDIQMQNLLQGIDKQIASEESAVNDLVLNALSSSGVEIGAKFSFKTKMDDFRVGQVSFSGSVVTK